MDKNHKELIKIVRQRLWATGHRTKTFLDRDLGFDLLVDGKFKVIVIADEKNGTCAGDGLDETIHTIAMVSFDNAGRPVVLYTNAGVPTLSIKQIFGINNSKEKNGKKIEGKKESAKTGKSTAKR